MQIWLRTLLIWCSPWLLARVTGHIISRLRLCRARSRHGNFWISRVETEKARRFPCRHVETRLFIRVWRLFFIIRWVTRFRRTATNFTLLASLLFSFQNIFLSFIQTSDHVVLTALLSHRHQIQILDKDYPGQHGQRQKTLPASEARQSSAWAPCSCELPASCSSDALASSYVWRVSYARILTDPLTWALSGV